jgi:putative transposase
MAVPFGGRYSPHLFNSQNERRTAMTRTYTKRVLDRKQKPQPDVVIPLPLDRDQVRTVIEERLFGTATDLALLVGVGLLEDEVNQLCGPRYQRQPDRERTRYGRQSGVITLAGQKLPVARPRVRYTDGRGEAELSSYAAMQRDEAMPAAALRRLLRGVSCRDYADVVERAAEGFGIDKSSVSRAFVRATAAEVEKLAQRRFDGERFLAIFIDGVQYAGETMVVALGVNEAGVKRILGLRQGATENAQVCTSLLEELRERGLRTDLPTLFVLDGSKALTKAVRDVWGRFAVVQRCQEHKKRNVEAHVPKEHWPEVKRRLEEAYRQTSHAQAVAMLKGTIKLLERINPDAAASLREGWEETLTVIRLGVPELLRTTLRTTNPIESALSIADDLTARVKRWRDGDMRQRWCAAGLLRAESKFRRIKGHRHLTTLEKSLDKFVEGKEVDDASEVA